MAARLTADAIAFVKRKLLDVTAPCRMGFTRRHSLARRGADQGDSEHRRAGHQSKKKDDFAHNPFADFTGEGGDYAAREERISAMAHLTLRIAGVF
jgi:hypothetical protein